MAPKKILILTTFYKPFIGGAEVATEEFVKRLKDKFNFIIFTARISRNLPMRENDGGIVIHRLGFGSGFDKYLFPALVFFKSFSIEFDCIYSVMAGYSGMAALLIKAFRGKPYILNLQSGTIMDKLERKNFFWAIPIYKQILARADYVQAISSSLRNHALKIGTLPERTFIVSNGVFTADFKPISNGRQRRIIAVSRLEPVKGIKYLVKAMTLVLAEFPDAELWVAGDGSERKNIDYLVTSLGLGNSVKIFGKKQRHEIPQFMNSGTIFVLPSLAEGLGIACLEAMACGLAVVATRVGGILDIIKDGSTGLLANPADSNDLAEKIISLMSDEYRRKSLAAGGLELVRDYDWSKLSIKLAELFHKL